MLFHAIAAICLAPWGQSAQTDPYAVPGQLTILDKDRRPTVLAPLKGTNVSVDIAGISARVTLVQTFQNPGRTPIEAVYTFPMAADAAVDRMRMNVAGRVIVGQIKRREEARQIYENARASGQVASLLDQERPNVFTQNVANILPGATVEVEISYVQTLKFEDGQFEFSFPMVVGPRYLPALTPDPEKVSPPTLAPGVRSGAAVSLTVHLDAGAELEGVNSVLHDVDTKRVGKNAAVVELKRKDEIPNRDFILKYRTKGQGIREQLVTHGHGDGTGSFCLVLSPPVNVPSDIVRPREVVFVMDQSGSQSGFPIQKSKELTTKLIDAMRTTDTFNVVAFSNGARKLWPEARQNTPANVTEAKAFVNGLDANGGTEFLPAIEMSLAQPPTGNRLKLVVFNTDGFIGNEFEILDRIQKYRDRSRMFTFGIGNGVNRFLIDAMSAEGRGASETVTLAENADTAVANFLKRTQSPVLTDVSVQFDGVKVADVSPKNLEDLFAGRPVVVTGRYLAAGKGTVTVTGRTGAGPWKRVVAVDFGPSPNAGTGVTSLWARRMVDDLTRTDWLASMKSTPQQRTDGQNKIIDLSLKYGIMTQYTSFVAVEQKVVNVGGKQRKVAVPVEMTDGVTMGSDTDEGRANSSNRSTFGVARGGGGGAGPGSPVAGRPSTTAMLGKAKSAEQQENGLSLDLKSTNEAIKSGRLDPLVKVDSSLHKKSGPVVVQVKVTDVSTDVLKALEKAGLKIEDKDKGLKVVFGTIDGKKLAELAKVSAVLRISPVPVD
ncbi:MAG: VWA domain-containing protein [Armatimonadetes bacterium]|nr:VWA domain-containing protein [Armatimonadota bacterium]